MAIKAEAVLENIKREEKEKLKSISVEKDIDLEFDLGNLMAFDSNSSDSKQLRNNHDEYLRTLARGNTQLLFNEVWKLPIERNQEAVLAKLPLPSTVLPREKPAPKPKPPTKWEEYAKAKGIKKKKRDKMIWDEKSQSWRPRYGYKRANDATKEWVLEVPKNAGPTEDMFEKKNSEKRERTAKNELQRLRNIARRTGKKVPGVGLLPVENQKSTISELEQSFHLAKKSTASLGRFEENLKNETPQKNRGKKRKFEPLISAGSSEKDRQLKILNLMYKKTPAINVTKAANRELHESQSSEPRENGKKKHGKRSNQGGKSKYTKKRGGKR